MNFTASDYRQPLAVRGAQKRNENWNKSAENKQKPNEIYKLNKTANISDANCRGEILPHAQEATRWADAGGNMFAKRMLGCARKQLPLRLTFMRCEVALRIKNRTAYTHTIAHTESAVTASVRNSQAQWSAHLIVAMVVARTHCSRAAGA